MIKVFGRADGSAEVQIYDPIGENWYGDGVTAKKFRNDLKALGNVSAITVRINSPGGEVFDGFAIYNALKEHPATVTVHVDGLAASIASVIAMAGDQVYMGEGAMFMVHSPWTIAMGDSDNMRSVADMLDKIEVGLVDAYVSGTGQDRGTVESWMEGETWFTRDEAISAGLADEFEPNDTGEAAAAYVKILAQQQFRAFAMSRTRKTPKSSDITVSLDFDADEFTKRIAAACESLDERLLQISKPPQATADINPSAAADSTSEEDVTMTTKDTSATDAADIRNQALAQDKARRDAIRSRFGTFAAAHRDLLDACLDDPNVTAEVAGERLLVKLGEGYEPTRTADVTVVADARDKFRAGVQAALAAKAGVGKREEGNEFNGDTLSDIAAKSLSLAGVSIRGLSRDAIARKVLAVHTSSDFPNLLSSTAGKVLQNAYGAFPATWNAWCAKGSVSDFKIHPRIQIGSFNSLATIAEGSEYTYGSLAEEYENAQAVTKGKAIALTRQMIVNDDLGGFARRAQLMGRAAARSVNSDVYAHLTGGSSNHGPTSADTGQYFNATASTTAGGHQNLTDTGTAITTASIALGRKTMRIQKDQSNREVLNILPKYLVCSALKEDVAWAVLNSTSDPSQSNPAKKNYAYDVAKLNLVTDPYLDGIGSGLPWYLFADPMDIAAFEVVFLDGNETPFIDEAVDFDTDAMKFKVRLDYGVANGDWRAGYLNDGA
jgi:ATP-dependent protease ClpP protease subunit